MGNTHVFTSRVIFTHCSSFELSSSFFFFFPGDPGDLLLHVPHGEQEQQQSEPRPHVRTGQAGQGKRGEEVGPGQTHLHPALQQGDRTVLHYITR